MKQKPPQRPVVPPGARVAQPRPKVLVLNYPEIVMRSLFAGGELPAIGEAFVLMCDGTMRSGGNLVATFKLKKVGGETLAPEKPAVEPVAS